jgi:hypothetical protein
VRETTNGAIGGCPGLDTLTQGEALNISWLSPARGASQSGGLHHIMHMHDCYLPSPNDRTLGGQSYHDVDLQSDGMSVTLSLD